MNAVTPPAGAQTISRAIRALKLIAGRSPEGMRLVDVASHLQLERPTAHRLLKALTGEGMLVRDPVSRKYTLGALVFELGLASVHQFNLGEICRPVLAALAERTGDTSFLFVRSANDAVCLSRVQGNYPIQTPAVPVGSRQPLGVNAGGLALLSCLPEHEVTDVIEAVRARLSIYGNLDEADLRIHVGQARKDGFARIANRAVPGVSAIGMPVRSSTGAAIAAITVATTQGRMTELHVQDILPLLRGAATELGELLRQ